jgi:hypothetical protein
MSAGAVFQEALRVLNRQHLPAASQRTVVAALEAGRSGLLTFLYEAGAEANLSRTTLLYRAAAIYFSFCAANLCDDLTDGDCTYLAEPLRTGPCVQYILHNLSFHALVRANLTKKALSTAAQDLVACGGKQLIEIRTRRWNARTFRDVGEGIAGRQWAAYLRILWNGTRLDTRAATVGMNLGIAVHVAEDIRTSDLRYTTLSKTDKQKILAWARTAAKALREEKLRCIDVVLLGIEPILKGSPRNDSENGRRSLPYSRLARQ